MKWMSYLLVALLVPMLARAQTPGWSPPPLVPAPEQVTAPNAPPAPPPIDGQYGTPAPPSNTPNAKPYLPYGPQTPKEPPGPEVGLMVSESFFGMLSAAGIVLLPFFLFGFWDGGGVLSGDPTISTVIALLLFGSAPLAIAQTQVSIANGSRHYTSDSWPAALAGIGAAAAVLGLTYLTGRGSLLKNAATCPTDPLPGAVPSMCGNNVLLRVGSVVVVPLIQMAVINLTKQPRFRPAMASRDPKTGALALGIPMPTPLIGPTSAGFSVGANVSLIDWRF